MGSGHDQQSQSLDSTQQHKPTIDQPQLPNLTIKTKKGILGWCHSVVIPPDSSLQTYPPKLHRIAYKPLQSFQLPNYRGSLERAINGYACAVGAIFEGLNQGMGARRGSVRLASTVTMITQD